MDNPLNHINKTLYIAGPMTGYADLNYPAFNAAAKTLREKGFKVINPAENVIPDDTTDRWKAFMCISIPQVITSGGVLLLDGWQRSKGAKLEVHNAEQLQIPITFYTWFLQIGFDKIEA